MPERESLFDRLRQRLAPHFVTQDRADRQRRVPALADLPGIRSRCRSKTVFAWLLERPGGRTYRPLYWCGGNPVGEWPEVVWTEDSLKATRFATRIEARNFALRKALPLDVRAIEHGWMS